MSHTAGLVLNEAKLGKWFHDFIALQRDVLDEEELDTVAGAAGGAVVAIRRGGGVIDEEIVAELIGRLTGAAD